MMLVDFLINPPPLSESLIQYVIYFPQLWQGSTYGFHHKCYFRWVLLWDGIKSGLPVTLDYVQSKAQGYILDGATVAKLEDLSQQLPEEAKTSKDSLIAFIENNQEWKTVSQQIVKSTQFTQNILGENAKGVQADKIDTLNM